MAKILKNFKMDGSDIERLRIAAAKLEISESETIRQLIPTRAQIEFIAECGRWYDAAGKTALQSFWDFVGFCAKQYAINNGALRVNRIQAAQATPDACLRMLTGAMMAARGVPGYELVEAEFEPGTYLVKTPESRNEPGWELESMGGDDTDENQYSVGGTANA